MNKISHSRLSAEMQIDNETCNLFIFGYSSKLFRDDEKAVEIDNGKHLIPWIGNESIHIDRYDVRGYFSDLSQYEFSGDYHNYSLTEEEKQIDRLCDNERYRALFHNDEEQNMYEEEGLKRSKHSLRSQYSQVSYQYSDSEINSETPQKIDNPKDLEEPFIPSPLLNIPPNVIMPIYRNLNKIIEKTAYCVFKNGQQMEIIIKTRQAQNDKFDFLNKDNDLYPYYEFILHAMKEGSYKHSNNISQHDTVIKEELRPQEFSSLFNVVSAPDVTNVDIHQSQDCPYNMLVNNIHMIKHDEIDHKSVPCTTSFDSDHYA